jgi:glutaminyl-peptide cyclotransferase
MKVRIMKSDSPKSSDPSVPRPSRGVYYGAIALAALLAIAGIMILNNPSAWSQRPPPSNLKLENIPFNGERAFEHLEAICALGPRVSATQKMLEQQKYLQAHFEKCGGEVTLQEFEKRHPENGATVTLANMIVKWHLEKADRILLCTHYDTRPYADNDPNRSLQRKPGVFLGANDGASGAALFCEMAEKMKDLPCKYGVDFVLFDGEEFIFDSERDRDGYFLGSKFFAGEYATKPHAYNYKWGVLVDMIGDKELQIYREVNSMGPESQALVTDIWSTARQLGVREFIPQTVHEVRDDHLALLEIGKIPTIDIIDFDYPRPRATSYWHTTKDIPANCSALSLAKVGYVLEEWLKKAK